MKVQIFYTPFYNLAYIPLRDVKSHRHHPMQITIGLNRDYKIRPEDVDWVETQLSIIGPDTLHAVDGNEDWQCGIQLLPESEAGQAIQQRFLADRSFSTIPLEEISNLIPLLREKQGNMISREELASIVSGVCEHLLGYKVALDFGKGIDPRIREAIQMIEDLPIKQISLEEVASQVHISPSRLRHLFKENTGISLRNFILQLRVKEIFKKADPDKSLTQLAYETGFTDLAHMTKSFKRMSGVVPRDFHQMLPHVDIQVYD